jgi:hypothetical protein
MCTMFHRLVLLLFSGDHQHNDHPDNSLVVSVPTLATNLKKTKISHYNDNPLKMGVKLCRVTSNVCQPIENVKHNTGVMKQTRTSTVSLRVSALLYNIKDAVHIM